MPKVLTAAHRPLLCVLATLAGAALLAACAAPRAVETAPTGAGIGNRAATAADAGDGPSPLITDNLPELPADGAAVVVNEESSVLKPGAPRSYTVQRGDTLWGLANMFLRDPWLWPEIWFVNPQLANPHLIYPGDVLTLVSGRDGRTQVQLARGPVTRLSPTLRNSGVNADGAIPTIPYDAIRAFLGRPGIITAAEVKAAPYVLSVRDGHLVAGLNNTIYLHGVATDIGTRYNVIHVQGMMRGGAEHKKVGYLTVYAGSVQVSRKGDPTSATVTESDREIQIGDVLIPGAPADITAIKPHVPGKAVESRVIAVADGVNLVGNYRVVAIDQGHAQGLEVGHVLRAWNAAETAADHCAQVDGAYTCNRLRRARLPAESAGTLLVFKVLEQVSYALVVDADTPVRVNDRVSKP